MAGRRALTAALLAAALAAAGCGPSGGDPAVLRFWGLGREGEVVRQLVPEFERRRPDIRVDVQQIAFTAAHEKLLTAVVGNALPDAAQVGNTWVPEFAALKAIEPLDARIAASATVRREGYFRGVWDTNVVEGTTWAVPWYVDTRLLFYRTDLLPVPPRTWQEWLDAAQALKDRGHAFGQLFPTDEWAQPVALGLQAGSPILRDGGRYGAFRGPEFRRAFTFYVEFFRRGLAPAASNAQIGNLYQQFAEGWFGLYVTGPWNLGEFRSRLPAPLQGAWATAPLPHPDDSTRPGVSLAGGSSLVVCAGSPRADAAWAFLEYLSEPATQLRFYRLMGNLPARVEPWEDPLLADDARARAFRVQLDHVVPTPQVPEWEQVAQKVAEVAEAALRGRAEIDPTLARMDAAVDRILEKRRWMLDRERTP